MAVTTERAVCAGVFTLVARPAHISVSWSAMWLLAGGVWALDAELSHKGVAAGRRLDAGWGYWEWLRLCILRSFWPGSERRRRAPELSSQGELRSPLQFGHMRAIKR